VVWSATVGLLQFVVVIMALVNCPSVGSLSNRAAKPPPPVSLVGASRSVRVNVNVTVLALANPVRTSSPPVHSAAAQGFVAHATLFSTYPLHEVVEIVIDGLTVSESTLNVSGVLAAVFAVPAQSCTLPTATPKVRSAEVPEVIAGQVT
jgi:hypothetical protein